MFRVILLLPVLGGLWPAVAGAQGSGTDIYDQQLRVRLDQQRPVSQTATLDGGGWFSFALFKYDDANAQRFRTLRKSELRLWAQANIADAHTGYIRALTGYEDWNAGDNPRGHGDDYIDPVIERAWYEADVAKIIGLDTDSYGLKIRVGRQLMEIGTGLALSMPLDAVRAQGYVCDFNWLVFYGKDVPDWPNIDTSSAIHDRSKREFFGAQLSYTGLTNHEIFAYYLMNNDMSSEDEPNPVRRQAQDFGYDSQYIGAGSRGSILDPNLYYSLEVVGEVGRNYSQLGTGATGQDEICAMALDVQVEYLFQQPMQPKVWFQYLHATGDSDRASDTTNTVGGNLLGTRDRAFNGFGFRDTGIAYAPDISNLNMFQVGGSLVPFEKHRWLKNMEVGTKVYFYSKANDDAPTGDSTITDTNSQWLGWEWDVYVDWRVTSDVSFTVRYGNFQPGAAYDNDQDCRHFLYAALTYSF